MKQHHNLLWWQHRSYLSFVAYACCYVLESLLSGYVVVKSLYESLVTICCCCRDFHIFSSIGQLVVLCWLNVRPGLANETSVVRQKW